MAWRAFQICFLLSLCLLFPRLPVYYLTAHWKWNKQYRVLQNPSRVMTADLLPFDLSSHLLWCSLKIYHPQSKLYSRNALTSITYSGAIISPFPSTVFPSWRVCVMFILPTFSELLSIEILSFGKEKKLVWPNLVSVNPFWILLITIFFFMWGQLSVECLF